MVKTFFFQPPASGLSPQSHEKNKRNGVIPHPPHQKNRPYKSMKNIWNIPIQVITSGFWGQPCRHFFQGPVFETHPKRWDSQAPTQASEDEQLQKITREVINTMVDDDSHGCNHLDVPGG